MLAIKDTLVSEEVLERKFVCDLAACKGACCVEGDAGAPLEDEEVDVLEEIYDNVKPYLRPEGIAAIEQQGKWVMDWDGEKVTPLVDDKECAYTTFDKDGTAKCGIEQAYRDGKVDFFKPISCHLYPVRLSKLTAHTAVNYDQWKICKPACACGEEMNVPVFRFLKEPLTRKFGSEWYEMLCEAAKLYAK